MVRRDWLVPINLVVDIYTRLKTELIETITIAQSPDTNIVLQLKLSGGSNRPAQHHAHLTSFLASSAISKRNMSGRHGQGLAHGLDASRSSRWIVPSKEG